MAYDSVPDALHQETTAAVEAIGLSIGGTVVSVAARKLPKAEESLDTLPLIVVAPSDRPPREQPWDSGTAADGNARALREHLFDVVVIAAGNRDPVTGLPEYLQWRQKVSRRFGQPKALTNVAELYDTRVEPMQPIDRAAYAKQYDYSGLTLRFRCVEPAT